MAQSGNTAVTITAIIAILVIVGLVFYFVREEADDDIEIDLGSAVTQVLPDAGGERPFAA